MGRFVRVFVMGMMLLAGADRALAQDASVEGTWNFHATFLWKSNPMEPDVDEASFSMPVLQTGNQFSGETLVNGETVTLTGTVSGTHVEYAVNGHLGVDTSATYYEGAGSGDYITGTFDGSDTEGNRWKGVFDVVIADRPELLPEHEIRDAAAFATSNILAVVQVAEVGMGRIVDDALAQMDEAPDRAAEETIREEARLALSALKETAYEMIQTRLSSFHDSSRTTIKAARTNTEARILRSLAKVLMRDVHDVAGTSKARVRDAESVGRMLFQEGGFGPPAPPRGCGELLWIRRDVLHRGEVSYPVEIQRFERCVKILFLATKTDREVDRDLVKEVDLEPGETVVVEVFNATSNGQDFPREGMALYGHHKFIVVSGLPCSPMEYVQLTKTTEEWELPGDGPDPQPHVEDWKFDVDPQEEVVYPGTVDPPKNAKGSDNKALIDEPGRIMPPGSTIDPGFNPNEIPPDGTVITKRQEFQTWIYCGDHFLGYVKWNVTSTFIVSDGKVGPPEVDAAPPPLSDSHPRIPQTTRRSRTAWPA